MKKVRTLIKGQIYRLYLFAAALVLAVGGIMPFMMTGHAGAYFQIGNRALSISSAVPSQTGVKYTFTFKLNDPNDSSPGHIQSLRFIACTTAVSSYPTATYPGDCTAPSGWSGANNGFANATFNAGTDQSGWQDPGTFSLDGTGNNAGVYPEGCNPSDSELCLTRTATTNNESDGLTRTVTLENVKNPDTANTSFYIGVFAYSSANYTNLVYFGATASAVTQTLETDAAVAEVLQFCVGSTTVDDVDVALPGNLIANDCSGVSGTNVNIGTLDTSAINISPVPDNGGNNANGVAMVRSNAGNGVAISYDAIQDTGTNHLGTLRIAGSNCSASAGPGNSPGAPAASGPFTDDCIDAAGTSQNVFGAGSEEFGMTVAGINSNGTSSYACQYGDTGQSLSTGNTCHLEPQTNYMGAGASGTEDYGTGNGFAWDESGASTTIASSALSSVPQVDDEALIVKFAATPAITTPFGRYSVKTDFIAVPTY